MRFGNILRFLAAAGVLCVGQLATAQPLDRAQPSALNLDALMQRKLKNAQSLLKGLALDQPDSIQRAAHRLQLLSLDAGWNVVQTKEYARISGEFRTAAKQIAAAGKAKNLDAAALGYVKLTMSCIDCHRHVRGRPGAVRRPPPPK